MSGSIFRHEQRVSYSLCTIGNHVYYSRYLDILEVARGEFFRHLGLPFLLWQEREIAFPVVECQLRYKGAARYDDVLTVEVWLTEAERIRLNFAYRILNQDGRTLVEGTTHHICASLHDKPTRLPEELRVALQPYLTPAPASLPHPSA